jgi:hypothetical protein
MKPFIKDVSLESRSERVASCREPLLVSYKLIFHVQIGNVIVPVQMEQPNFAELEKIICDSAVKIFNDQVNDNFFNDVTKNI